MGKQKFKIGDRVKVVNKWARSTSADVKNGETGTVTLQYGPYCVVKMDRRRDGGEHVWSMHQRGLALVTKGGKKR